MVLSPVDLYVVKSVVLASPHRGLQSHAGAIEVGLVALPSQLPLAWIEHVSEPIADEVEAQHSEEDERARND